MKVAVGVGAILVASVVASPFAAAAVPHHAIVAPHSARVGTSHTVRVPLTVVSSRQGSRVPAVASKSPASLWPHWGPPKV